MKDERIHITTLKQIGECEVNFASYKVNVDSTAAWQPERQPNSRKSKRLVSCHAADTGARMSYSKVQNSHEHYGNVSSEYRYMCSMDNQQPNKPEQQLHNAY